MTAQRATLLLCETLAFIRDRITLLIKLDNDYVRDAMPGIVDGVNELSASMERFVDYISIAIGRENTVANMLYNDLWSEILAMADRIDDVQERVYQ